MMFTKKTRLVSGLVAVLMLISLFTAFVLPAVAAPAVNDWDQYEAVSETGMTNLSTLDDIKDYTVGTPMFKVTDAEGIRKIAELVNGGDTLTGVSIYQTNDIDMNWEPFGGIGGYYGDKYYPFSGTFNGNGFTIDNLYVLRNSDNVSAVGLFGATVNATLKNIGIAGGLVVGSRKVGAIAGYAENTSIENCWNAATVVGGSDQGTAGIAGCVVDVLLEGSTASKAKVINSYNVGLIFNREATASGIVGFIDTEDATRATGAYVKNCYNAGEIVAGMNGYKGDAHRLQGNSIIVGGNYLYGFGECANNYYVKGHGKADLSVAEFSAANNGKFEDGFAITSTDGAAGVDTAAELADAINANMSVTDTGYKVVYEYTDAGYPALAYQKNGTTVIRRVAHTSSNVCKNTWAEKSELFAKVSAGRDGAWALASGTKLNDLEIATANDLFVLGLIASFGSYKSAYGNGNITITANIDMAKMDLCPVEYYVPIASGGSNNDATGFNGTLDGGNHIIKNWKYLATIHGGSANGGLISLINTGGVVKNLGMVDAYGIYEFAASSGNTYASLLLERGYGNFTVTNCYAEGAISVADLAANANNYGGVFSTFWKEATPNISDCWSDVTLIRPDADNETSKIRVLGKVPAEVNSANISNLFYVADEEPYFGNGDNNAINFCTRLTTDYSTADGSLAAYMNEFCIQKWGCYDGKTTFARSNDEAVYLLTISKQVGGYEVGTEKYQYNAGATVQLPVIEGYELDTSRLHSMPSGVEKGTITMPGKGLTLYYRCTEPDYSILEDIITKYDGFDFSYFSDASELEDLLLLAQDTLDHKDVIDPAVGLEIINRVVAGEQNMNLELAGAYPNYPKMKDYEVYAKYNTTNNWAITDLEDWQAVVALANADSTNRLSGYSFHLTGDVDLKSVAINPIHPAKTYSGFAGTIDGHGYAFKNMNMNRNLADGHCVALVGYGNGCTIKNLGIANGTIKGHGSSAEEIFVAAFMGETNGASISYCWNAATIDATGGTSGKGQSISGIARLNGGSSMDNCFNIGLVTGNGYVGALSGAAHTCTIYNSFGVVYSDMRGSQKSLTRFSQAYLESKSSNMYMIGKYDGITFDCQNTDVDRTDFILEADAYETGEIAWRINATYEGKGDQPYYTVDQDGKVTFGNVNNQARRITYKVNGDVAGYAYVAGGSQYKLNYKLGSQYKLAAGSAGTITNGILSVPDADVVIDVTLSNYNYDSLAEALALYTDGIYPYLANGEAVEALVNDVTAKIANGSYTSQEEIAADAQALRNAFVYAGYPNLPSIEDYSKYPEVPGYLVGTLEELETLVSVRTSLTADQTIYLTDDITVTAKSAANSMDGLRASIDGMGHAIKGVTMSNSTGWLGNYNGSSIKNLVLDSWTSIYELGGSNYPGLLMNRNKATLELENITVQSCSITRTESGNGMAILMAISEKPVTMRNITLLDNTYNMASGTGNSGMLIGRADAGIVVNGVYAKNNTFSGTGNTGSGILFGEIAPKEDVDTPITMNNVGVIGTTYAEGTSVKGILVGRLKQGTLSVDNAIIEGAGCEAKGLIELYGENTTPVVSSVTNLYTDITIIHNSGDDKGTKVDLVVKPANATTNELKYGAAAYRLNKAGVAQKWEIKDGLIVFDTNGEGSPVEITFQLRDGAPYAKFYTDVEGHMVNFTEEFFSSKEWEGYTSYTALANKKFGQDATIIQAECQHVWGEYKSNKDGTHYRECTKGCGVTKGNEDCSYGAYTYDTNRDRHSRTCEYCKYVETSPCTYSTQLHFVEATCQHGLQAGNVCTVCEGFKVRSTTGAPVDHSWSGYDHDDTTEGAASQHTRKCVNCKIPETVPCNFDEGVYHKHSTGVLGYTHYTCADCGYEYDETDSEYRHDWVEEQGEIVKVPTYIQDGMTPEEQEACKGKTKIPCKYCDAFTYKDIDALTGIGVVVNAPASTTPESSVDVTLNLINNQADVAGLNVAITYDKDVLSLKNIANGTLFKQLGGDEGVTDDGYIVLSFANADNVVGDGEFATLTFAVSGEFLGNTMVTAEIVHSESFNGEKDGSINEKGEPVQVGGSSALIAVSNQWGDADMDGDVDVADAIHVMRYVAGRVEENAIDLIAANTDTKNDKITLGDAILILRSVAGFYTPAP